MKFSKNERQITGEFLRKLVEDLGIRGGAELRASPTCRGGKKDLEEEGFAILLDTIFDRNEKFAVYLQRSP